MSGPCAKCNELRATLKHVTATLEGCSAQGKRMQRQLDAVLPVRDALQHAGKSNETISAEACGRLAGMLDDALGTSVGDDWFKISEDRPLITRHLRSAISACCSSSLIARTDPDNGRIIIRCASCNRELL